MSRGYFISFEGGEGVGKSTQIQRLTARLISAGHSLVATREPGGSPGAESIRDLVLRGSVDRWSPMTETLLMYAARRDHIERVINPALDRGDYVVCDRYADSTRAYQGLAGGVDAQFIDALEKHVLEGAQPNLTLIFDLDPKIGLARASNRAGAEMRFESKGLDFHSKLRAAFLKIAADEPERCVVIDASGTLDQVAAQIWQVMTDRALG